MTSESRSLERRYLKSSDQCTFTKVEIPSWSDINGITQHPWKSEARITNEYYALKYIAAKTKIPVPKALRLERLNGKLAIVTELVDGVLFDDLAPEVRSSSYLNEYVETFIIPQLRALTSNTLGALTGEVIPPRRIFEFNPQGQWLPQRSTSKIYRFCHNDLAQHNFLCDEVTGKVKAVIDWEYAGFYPPEFEAPLWRAPYYETVHDPEEIVRLEQLLESAPEEPGCLTRVWRFVARWDQKSSCIAGSTR